MEQIPDRSSADARAFLGRPPRNRG